MWLLYYGYYVRSKVAQKTLIYTTDEENSVESFEKGTGLEKNKVVFTICETDFSCRFVLSMYDLLVDTRR